MSNKKNAEAVGAESEVMTEPVETPAKLPRFTIERLRRDCFSLFGVTTSTFDGATFGLKGEYTVEDMRQRLKGWQTAPVAPAKKKKEVN